MTARLRTSPALPPAAIARARALRRGMTPGEARLWSALRRTFPQAHFRKQVPFGRYCTDFACHRAKLVIEVDGSQHAEAQRHDAERTVFLNGEGYRVLRFWNNEVMRDLDGVLTAIAANLPSPLVGEGAPKGRKGGARRSRARAEGPHPHPPTPSPQGGGGASDNLRSESV